MATQAELDRLETEARERIGGLRSKVLRPANGVLPHDYIVPSGVYEEQWDWDAFFVGLRLVSADKADGLYLKNWCLNFLRFTEPDGHTPGGIRPWSGRDARLYHIKPLMGQAAWYASLALCDFDWVRPVWETMCSCVTYRRREMSDQATGLVKWWDSLESGADNNPALVRRYHNCVAGADVNGFMVLDYRAMARVAGRLGKRREEAEFERMARELAADEPLYNNDNVIKPYSNWQGPIWPHAN